MPESPEEALQAMTDQAEELGLYEERPTDEEIVAEALSRHADAVAREECPWASDELGWPSFASVVVDALRQAGRKIVPERSLVIPIPTHEVSPGEYVDDEPARVHHRPGTEIECGYGLLAGRVCTKCGYVEYRGEEMGG